jgi:hypothetical protein
MLINPSEIAESSQTGAPSGDDLRPDRTFDFETLHARDLTWLPLAIRYKLDQSGLIISLQAWQALSMELRTQLLACPLNEAFRENVIRLIPATLVMEKVNETSRCCAVTEDALLLIPNLAETWSKADQFNRYLLGKMLGTARRKPA